MRITNWGGNDERERCSNQELCVRGANRPALPTSRKEKKEYVLSKQVLRCGTSIGANVEEAIGGQSRADFLSKLSIAYKEARETSYWLRLLKVTDYLTDTQFQSIHADAEELCRIIGAIQKSTKDNPAPNS